jgi:hypothetical protein
MTVESVFVLSGAAQPYVNALEARSRWNIPRGHGVLVAPQSVAEFVTDISEWKSVVPIPYRYRAGKALDEYTGIMNARAALSSLSEASVDRLFINNMQASNCAIAHRLMPKEVIVLDDGLGTLIEASARHEGKVVSRRLSNLRRAVWGLAGLSPAQISSVTFFSAYDLPLLSHDDLVQNDYASIRERISDRRVPELWILGQALYEPPLRLSGTDYWGAVSALVDRFPALAPVYYGHKTEKPCTVSRECNRLGIEARTFRRPIELSYAGGLIPIAVGGFTSSALLTTRIILGEHVEVVAADVREQVGSAAVRKEYGDALDAYERAGVRIVTL